MAMTRKFDAIVIGTGQSGPPLADRLTQEGLRTAIIERKHVGGTCVNTGCIPTKTLVASARIAHQARRAAEYGVKVGRQLSVDMKRVKARKDRISLPVAHRRDTLDKKPAERHVLSRACALRESAHGARE